MSSEKSFKNRGDEKHAQAMTWNLHGQKTPLAIKRGSLVD
jgi:hypothetical protein